LIPPLGRPERRLAEIRIREPFVGAPRLAWCPDAKCIIATDSTAEGKPDALFVVSLETGEKQQLTHPQPPVLGDSNPAISPDGHSLVFRRNLAFAAGELYFVPLGEHLTAVGESRRLTLARLDAAARSSIREWIPRSTN
jgi:hypothetical protein